MSSDLYLIINFCISTFVFISIVVGGKKNPKWKLKKNYKKSELNHYFMLNCRLIHTLFVLRSSNFIFCMYSGTCAMRHLSFPTSYDIRQKFMVPKYFLLTKIKPEYPDILNNPTYFPCHLACRIRQVPLYMY